MADDPNLNPTEPEGQAPDQPESPAAKTPESGPVASSDAAADATPAGVTPEGVTPADAPESVAADAAAEAVAAISAAEAEPTVPAGSAAETPTAQESSGSSNTIDQAELDMLAAQFAVNQAAGGTEAKITSVLPKTEDDDLMAEMAKAIAEAQAEAAPAAAAAPTASASATPSASDLPVAPYEPASFDSTPPAASSATIELLDDVELEVRVELGRTEMYIEDVLHLGTGSVIELDKLAGDPVDVYVNKRLVARGEVLVLNDNFCVRINSIHSPIPELETA